MEKRRRRGPVKDIDERKTRIGGEKTEKGWRARRAGSWEAGKKASGRRTGCRRFSKDGTMEAKTETSLTGSRLPTRESTWPRAEATARASATWSVREYLSAFTSPIPRLFLLPCSPLFLIFLLLLLLLLHLPIPSLLFLHTSQLSSKGVPSPLATTFILGTPIRRVVSRKFTGNAFVDRVHPNSFLR